MDSVLKRFGPTTRRVWTRPDQNLKSQILRTVDRPHFLVMFGPISLSGPNLCILFIGVIILNKNDFSSE